MNKAELLAENTKLREALYREERSRFTQRRADLIRENKEMAAELASYNKAIVDGQIVALRPKEKKPPYQVKRPLRASRHLRTDLERHREFVSELRTAITEEPASRALKLIGGLLKTFDREKF